MKSSSNSEANFLTVPPEMITILHLVLAKVSWKREQSGGILESSCFSQVNALMICALSLQ